MSCPRCNGYERGRYHCQTQRFLCLNRDCARFGEVVNYGAFVEEYESVVRSFFDNFPRLTPGSSVGRIEEIAHQLLVRGVQPHLALELACAWNECSARPPMALEGPVSVVSSVEAVAARLRNQRAV